jgi:hypothetical protein
MSKAAKSHYFGFIDPEGTEKHWKPLEALFRFEGALMINYMHSGITQLVGSHHNTTGNTSPFMMVSSIYHLLWPR